VMLRLGLLQTAMDKHDPMQVFAAAKFEDLALKKEAMKGQKDVVGPCVLPISFETPQEAVLAIQAAIERKIGGLVSDGGINKTAIADIEAAMKLLDTMKQRSKPKDQKTGSSELDETTKKAIRELYGLA